MTQHAQTTPVSSTRRASVHPRQHDFARALRRAYELRTPRMNPVNPVKPVESTPRAPR
jgi:hypothetical protein